MADFTDRTVLLGISGGIAAYKSVELARLLVKRGARVKVVMTSSGSEFVSPLTFRTVTGNPVATSLWADPASPFPHISLSEEADLLVVAPATANIIAKYASGIADDLLSTTLLAARGTVVFAPSMNARMYMNPATQENLRILRDRGVVIVDPGEGELACREEGPGRMAEPARIVEALESVLDRRLDLAGKSIMVTAGPTREHIDPVRFISNPSSGRMGYAVAGAAARRGADVLLVSGPTSLECPGGVSLVSVTSAAEMKSAVLDNIKGIDALVMAAAVADFRPSQTAKGKIKKEEDIPRLRLERTDDILKAVAESDSDCFVVGFAAETHDVVENARRKLVEKNMNAIVANLVGPSDSGFTASTTMAALLTPGQGEVELEMLSKEQLAERILDLISSAFS